MTLDKKILLGFISCTLVLVIIAVISFRNSATYAEATALVTHTHKVLYELEQALLNTSEAESGVRGFVLKGDEEFLTRYTQSRTAVINHLAELEQLTRDNPRQQTNVSELREAFRKRIENLDHCVDLATAGNLKESQEFVASGTRKALQEAARGIATRIKKVEEELLLERNRIREEDAESFIRLFIMLITGIGLVLTAGYFVIMSNIRTIRTAEGKANSTNWHLSGSSELVRRMQGNATLQELTENILDALSSYLAIPVAAFYLRENTTLRLCSVHGLKKNNIPAFVNLREGLVGQSAAENKPVYINNIPDNTFNLTTTFGVIKATKLLAIPISLEENLIGVIELGSQNEIPEDQRVFLTNVSHSIAIAVTSALAREEIKELLEETQRQAEELEAQQHELRQTNEELTAKTELLENSESILKSQQEELQQANVELEEKANLLEEQKRILEEAKREIERKAEEISASSKYKSEFLANMSHELRTPLNSILILSQLLAENKQDRLSEKEVDHARNIYRSGTDLLNLINEILDLAKIESGKMSLDLDDFTVNELCSSLESTFSPVAENKGLTFQVLCADKNGTLHSDRQRVEQVLKNFLSNAMKFTPRGGKVTLQIQEHQNHFSFAVADTGIGIPDDKKEIIFEAFEQADGSTKRKYGGTGLGLSISRELANLLQGSIHMESEHGKGSTFTLSLPKDIISMEIQRTFPKEEIKTNASLEESVTGEATREHTSPDDRDNLQNGERIILIIEDDLKFSMMLLDFVRSRKYKGVIAEQGAMGISYARHYRPDAILLDMKVPVMDGIEVLKHLKADPELRHIPVQIISGYDYQKTSLSLGAFDFLRKPVELTDLHRAFDKIETFTSRKLKKLLIVEDNKEQNGAICELIGNGDVKCYSAYTGRQAQQLLSHEVFDCIIVDLGLPDMSGFELLEGIKKNKEMSAMPIIVYTGKDLQKDEADRLRKLSDTVVLKTVNSHERLFDETTLFLHRVESRLPKEKQMLIRKLHRSDEALRDKLVLLADDDMRNIYSLTSALEDEGVTCIVAENGKQAIAMLKQNPNVDLVLMDIMMPEMDGLEATIEIRKDERFTKLPIIALTAKAMKGDKESCLNAGMSDYVSKPVDIDKLLSLMRVWLYKP